MRGICSDADWPVAARSDVCVLFFSNEAVADASVSDLFRKKRASASCKCACVGVGGGGPK